MAMKISILGAGNEVTGSAYVVDNDQARVLVDCGQFQGARQDERRNTIPRAMDPRLLSATLISHGHLDHVGRLPLLVKKGYSKPIHATPATIDVAELILKDSAKVQEAEADRINRRRLRAGEEPVTPLYTDEDVDRVMKLFRPVSYNVHTDVAPGFQARFLESGHILGSSIVELTLVDSGKPRTIVISGDLGPVGMPILKDPATLQHADWVLMESTYGDRDHRPLDATVNEFYQLVREAIAHKGKILVPAFALGRTQQIIYHLLEGFQTGKIPRFPIYVDSPLGQAVSEVYLRHPELYDEAALALQGALAGEGRQIHFCQSSDESKALNDVAGPCMILAGSGMCTAGRILHHLKHNLWRKETTVIIVGYQAPGSLGRMLVDRRQHVRIFGEDIAVNATVCTLGGFSAHAGQSDLLRWYSSLAPGRPRTILVHGEEKGRKPLARLIEAKWGIHCELPSTGQVLS